MQYTMGEGWAAPEPAERPAPQAPSAIQQAMLGILDAEQPMPATQDEREALARKLEAAERKALRDAQTGRISFDEYDAVFRQAGRAAWLASLGVFGELAEDAA